MSYAESKEKSAIWMKMVQTPVWDLTDELKDEQVITIFKNEGANIALRTLCENDILNAPVVDELNRYCGTIDMMQLLTFSLDIFTNEFRPSRFSEDYLAKKRRFRNTSVSEILMRSREDGKSHSVHEDYSLFHVLETMCLSSKHRLAVVDSNNFVTGLVSQSMILRWLLNNIDDMAPSLKNAKCFDIRPFNLVTTIPISKRAIDAFKILKNEGITGVAAVDTAGRVADVISCRDLRGINPDSNTFRFLWNTIDFFKDQVRENYPDTPTRPVTISPNSTLESILRTMVDNKIHRLFVVSDTGDRRPLDLISATDILQYMIDVIKMEI